jgi:hypothetical protein
MEGETYVVTISKGDGKWEIDRKSLKVRCGDTIVWQFGKEKPDKAYFQFPYDLMVRTRGSFDVVERETLSKANADPLVLHILEKEDVVSTRPYYYAIFIENGFVEGENPPPRIEVGG